MSRVLISADTHIAVSPKVADDLPLEIREQVPHLEVRTEGAFLVNPGLQPPLREVRVEDPDDDERLAQIAMGPNCCSPGYSSYPEGRLAEMARDGIAAEVLIARFAFGRLFCDFPPEVERLYVTVCNDWLAETYKEYLGQFAPGIHLPTHDPQAAAEELQRAAAMGLRPALLPDAIMEHPYYEPMWEPVWEAAESLSVPITFHIAGNRNFYRPRLEPWPGQGCVGFALTCAGMAETIGWLVFGGVLERHPGLQVVMTECGAGWLSWLCEFYDYAWGGRFAELGNARPGPSYPGRVPPAGGHPKLEAPPSYYIRRQVKCTFMYDPVAVEMRYVTGLDALLWGSDYPHMEGVTPYAQDYVRKQFQGVDESEVDRIVRRNAIEVFGFSL